MLLQIKICISRKRCEFGAPVKFADQNDKVMKDATVECLPFEDESYSLKKVELDIGIQVYIINILVLNFSHFLGSSNYSRSVLEFRRKDVNSIKIDGVMGVRLQSAVHFGYQDRRLNLLSPSSYVVTSTANSNNR